MWEIYTTLLPLCSDFGVLTWSIWLLFSLDEEPRCQTVLTTSTVVAAPSVYNIIMGWLTLSSFQVVTLPYYQKIKFPVRNEAGEVQGEQQATRKCYVEMIRVDQKKSDGRPRSNRQEGRTTEAYVVQEGEPSLGSE